MRYFALFILCYLNTNHWGNAIQAQVYLNEAYSLGTASHSFVGGLSLAGGHCLLLGAHSPPQNKATFWDLPPGQSDLDSLGQYAYPPGFVYFNWNNMLLVDDSSIVIGGTAWPDSLNYDHPVVVKFNMEGVVIWETEVPSTRRKILRDGIKLQDQGFAFCGAAEENNSTYADFYLLRCDAAGQVLWERNIEFWGLQEAYSLTEASDGGFVLAGSAKLNTGLIALLIVKTDTAGNREWTRLLKETGDFALDMSIQRFQNGDYIVTGSAKRPIIGHYDGFAARLNAAGDTLWTRRYPKERYHRFGLKPYVLADGSFITGGYKDTPRADGNGFYHVGHLTHIDGSGNLIWERFYQINEQDSQDLYGFTPTLEGGILAYGVARSPTRAWVIKTDSLGCLEPGCTPITSTTSTAIVDSGRLYGSPNPFSVATQLRWSLPQGVSEGVIRVMDANGREVMRQPLLGSAPSGDVVWQNDRLPAGMYVAVLETAGHAPVTFLMVKQ